MRVLVGNLDRFSMLKLLALLPFFVLRTGGKLKLLRDTLIRGG